MGAATSTALADGQLPAAVKLRWTGRAARVALPAELEARLGDVVDLEKLRKLIGAGKLAPCREAPARDDAPAGDAAVRTAGACSPRAGGWRG